ncbi:hypothetical protein H310_14955 [Aphanomyces invadans]|uniref:DDE Tnp4 domain-containing protein n=1 Tax=Aphanomyces invadans TaxID=157072 RepID=A0A024T9A8_9STRA|nr:hypothetical protein H310_14955 [Aphanomyces invadans]ETV90211.1 hypothetical protein H310_14955 [Aphanomyces invadans]|eukprot:XP_008881157.1 hypothetical protein H310_14955 [Aphanomyces invadans]
MAFFQKELVLLLAMSMTRRQREIILALLAERVVERPLIPAVRFSIDAMTDANALLDYRFDVAGIKELGFVLGLSAVIVIETRNRVHRDEAMCIVLGRLTFPITIPLVRNLSHVINELYDRWGSLLYLNKKLLAQNMDRYCDAVTAKGAPLSNVFGFINGTKLQTCRISSTGTGENLQRQVYSGHNRIHCLNYQAVTAPDGICLHFWPR